MTLAYLLLVTGLTISAVAIYYSVVGLAAIFAAASIPIIIMGTTLEVAKLVCASWLKANWASIPKLMKMYMTVAVIVLMGITSMGIFGFLSKAHLDQAIPTGDIAAQVAMIDEKITTQKGIINDNRAVLRQLDEAVNQTMGRSTSEQGADRAVAIRKSQTKERAQANKAIDQAQVEVSKLQEQKAPIASKLRAVEAEVGPIKYIAAFVYGDNPDANVLEKAVTWVIIIIVSVFDPLAVIMLLAAQMTFSWHHKGNDPLSINDSADTVIQPIDTKNSTYRGHLVEEAMQRIDEELAAKEANVLLSEVAKESETEVIDYDTSCPKCGTILINAPGIGKYCPNKECDVFDGWLSYQQGELPFQKPEKLTEQINTISGDASAPVHFGLDHTVNSFVQENTEKEAKRKWKELNPEGSIHIEERRKELGLIDRLPWEDPSNLERPGDYVQNSEQTENSLWQRLSKRDDS